MGSQATLLLCFEARIMLDLEAFLKENGALVPGSKKTGYASCFNYLHLTQLEPI